MTGGLGPSGSAAAETFARTDSRLTLSGGVAMGKKQATWWPGATYAINVAGGATNPELGCVSVSRG